MSERHLGQTLGKYRIEELIGSGGFAWVYKAFDPELEIHVALKVLKPQFAGDETFEQRFRREASTAAKLRHPNIIKIYAVGRDGEAVYFAMDYYPSGLADRLEVSNSLPEEFVVRVGVDVAQALGYAHREGVIHRDIKVDNILFDNHGNAVVADFGIARALSGYSGQTGTNMVVGTPQYFAPEQARAKALDGRADIYSLGVTLYRASTGRLPFEGDDWYEIARQHVEEPPPPPRSLNPDLTPGFEAVILHCLEKQPDDRPATGEALAQELVSLLPATLETSAYRRRITSSEPTVIVRSDSHATPRAGIALPSKARAAAPLWIAGAAIVAGLAVAVPFMNRGSARDVDAAPLKGDSARGPVASGNPGTGLTPSDSALRDSVRKDSAVAPPGPLVGRLSVDAPPLAAIAINGRDVGAGGWDGTLRADSLYTVTATVNANAGCPTATAQERVRIRAGRTVPVKLSPRGCGTLAFDYDPKAGAKWTVDPATPDDSAFAKSGMSAPVSLLLPAGAYTIRIEKRQCQPFSETVSVTADRTNARPIAKLFCP